MTAPRPATRPAFYDAHVFCCTNERPEGHPRGCCKRKGSEKLRDYMKARAQGARHRRMSGSTAAGCLDRCELGPTMVIYPEGVWYNVTTREEIDEILQTHLVEGGRVERLMLQPEDKTPPQR